MKISHGWQCLECKAITAQIRNRRSPICARCHKTNFTSLVEIYTATKLEMQELEREYSRQGDLNHAQ